MSKKTITIFLNKYKLNTIKNIIHIIKRKDDKMSIKIVIDQGHNPSQINAGASFEELQEANITYQVGSYLAQLLNNDPRFEVKVTREKENTLTERKTKASARWVL